MKKSDTSNIYYKHITYENVFDTWNIVRKTCKNKKAIFRFHINKSTNIYNIYKVLYEKRYKPLPFRLFLIFEPKPRLVMSQSVSDKIVNHFVAKYYLLPYLENKLIDSNVATRKNRGSKYASKLIEDYINKIRLKYPNKEIYSLNIDISKYFYNIDHNILLNKLKKDIKDEDVLNLIKIIIDETNKPYVNEIIKKLNAENNIDIPLYKKGVGLSIGAMTSQFLAIYYLNDIDHYIKENLKCKYYIRYMDDFIILDCDKEKLERIWKKIKLKISELNLKINPKSNISKLSVGFSFVGYKYKIENNKFKIKYRKKTIRKIKKKLKVLREHDLLKYYKSYGSYYGYLKKINNVERNFKMKAHEKYDYYKKEYNNQIIFIKEGSFYKTYKDDAVIIWDLFKYKWNKDYIAFGISPSNKVFDTLREKSIGYLIVTEELINIHGDNEIYELYSRLANINYNKFKMKETLHNLLDEVLDKNKDNSSRIFDFLNKLNGVDCNDKVQ